MGMTPDQYFEAFVDPNRWDCHQMPGDIRRAFNAAVSTSHLADHYFTYHKRHNPEKVVSFDRVGQFVEHLVTQTNGSFRDIRSISNAYKHLYNSNGPSARFETINSCGSIERLQLHENNEIDEMEEEYVEGQDEESRLAVMFKRKDGTQSEFLSELDIVVDYLRDLIYDDA